eukprot:scaffold13580_cov67-Isochrysis_galbana.AAC.1
MADALGVRCALAHAVWARGAGPRRADPVGQLVRRRATAIPSCNAATPWPADREGLGQPQPPHTST